MKQSFKDIYTTVEAENSFNMESAPIIPTDILNRKMKKKELQRVQMAVTTLESMTNQYGLEILNTDKAFPVNKDLFESYYIRQRIAESKFDTVLKEAMLEVFDAQLLNEGFLDKAANLVAKAKEVAAKAVETTSNAAGAVADKAKEVGSKIQNFMSVAIEEATKVVNTFTSAMGEFGKAFLAFLKGFGEIDLKAGWLMFKEGKFLEMGKSVGNYFMNRFADAINVYKKIWDTLQKGVFANLAGSGPIDGLRQLLQSKVQDNLDDIFQPDTNNKEIKDIIEKNYLDAAAETVAGGMKEPFNPANPEHMKLAWKQAQTDALNDPKVIKATINDQGVAKTATVMAIRTAIGAGLAYLAWWTWNNMIFKGELIYDYDFSGALAAISGKFNLADWFLSDDGGFETLLWLIGGLMGGGIADWGTNVVPGGNVSILVVVTVIAIWAKKNPGTWKQIQNTDFAKKVIKVFNDSKKKIESGYNSVKQAFGDVAKKVSLLMKAGILKKSPVKA